MTVTSPPVAGPRPSLAERMVNRVADRLGGWRANRRSFLGGAAVVGAALAVDPFGYLVRPARAIDAVCGSDNTCAAGYTVFCCTINGGNNTCPPDSFIGGWWKADHSSFCGGNARYYIDCNAYRDGRYTCHCNTTTCDQRRVACNQFRYGQCNTQIPWSNTGPVLCRVITCTPPWVQFGGVCSSSSATDNNTATHSAPCLSGQVPVGVVEQISTSDGAVRITGWAYDPDQPATSLTIAITQDNRPLMGIHASLARPDVNAARHISGNHGFDVTFRPTPGVHTYVVYAYNIAGGSGNPRLGGYTVRVADIHAPVGHLDQCSPVGDSVVLTGWALDRDLPSAATAVNIYQDGKPLMGLHCGLARADVNAHYGVSGLHGFKAEFKTAPGVHNYKVYAMNAGPGPGNTLIGNHSLIVSGATAAAAWHAGLPGTGQLSGGLDSVVATGNSVRLTGWLRAGPERPVGVGVHVDGAELHWHPTGPDGRFDLTLPAAAGVHTYTVFAVEHTEETVELGRRTVRVAQAGAIGEVTGLHAMAGRVRLTGWAYDPDVPGTEQVLELHRDGAAVGRYRTGLPAPLAAPAEAGLSRSGFSLLVENPPGAHTYSVYVPAAGPGGRPVLIGSGLVPDESAPTGLVMSA